MPLVSVKALSTCMSGKVAASGLCYKHLEAAFRRDGLDGVSHLFSEKFDGKPRVTNSQKVIEKVANYFEKKTH